MSLLAPKARSKLFYPSVVRTQVLRRVIHVTARDVILNKVIASYFLPYPVRWRFLRALGMDVEHSSISAGCFFGSRRIHIGEGSFVNYGVFFDAASPITLGRNVYVASGVLFCTSSHELGQPELRGGAPTHEPIEVGSGTWIGSRAVILAGASIPEGCVIAAGAVVPASLAMSPNSIYGGVPARWLRDLQDD